MRWLLFSLRCGESDNGFEDEKWGRDGSSLSFLVSAECCLIVYLLSGSESLVTVKKSFLENILETCFESSGVDEYYFKKMFVCVCVQYV